MSSNKCNVGDTVIHKGKDVYVSQVIQQGTSDRKQKNGYVKKGTKAYITVCYIMPDNGQVLHRSPRNIYDDWEHKKE